MNAYLRIDDLGGSSAEKTLQLEAIGVIGDQASR